ncbi:SUPPRESSOR OF ABI3-5 [Quercus robur]|uniref:SUPPRESSOR OF ABI3-5 n=1 Tax=Quercus robur TaxID=38942 RepID=UPI0021634A03|nr:SUPPRESSOR OF ABI3-5 [Quercus robur]
MEGNSSRPNLKRPFFEDADDDKLDSSNKPSAPKRVRFPKGKKVKPAAEEAVVVVDRGPAVDDDPTDLMNPRAAAKERAKRRTQFTAELFTEESRGILNDVAAAEVDYKDNDSFVDDGIQIEPFNLDKEREEGYFDADGNFVEYVNDNEIKDAWLDSVEAEPKYAGKGSAVINNEDDANDLSSDDIGTMKRRIADILEPGETVLRALRRLKGTSNRKEKMSAESKIVFDQLTEDAMKLMENGEYDVYHEKQEVFQREAEGYERLAKARGEGISTSAGQGGSTYFGIGNGLLSDMTDTEVASTVLPGPVVDTLNPSASTAETSSNDADAYDMFGEEDENATAKPSFDGSNVVSGHNSDAVNQPSASTLNSESESGALQNDYVYDDSTGYYYSSSLGYYYDPSTGLFCSAASGQWYSYNEETGTYVEVQQVASNAI